MTRLNRITSANCPANRFISLFLCILDGDTGDLTFCNAGHNPPLIVRARGGYEQLTDAGSVLGMLPGTVYREYHATLAEGDALVIYSDGVTEAADPDGGEFGVEGLAAAVSPYIHVPVQTGAPVGAIIGHINMTLTTYTEGAQPADDVTLIVARRIAR
jgi:sigma-B regulation protein RsbU (phosphoserine phosphatase)